MKYPAYANDLLSNSVVFDYKHAVIVYILYTLTWPWFYCRGHAKNEQAFFYILDPSLRWFPHEDISLSHFQG